MLHCSDGNCGDTRNIGSKKIGKKAMSHQDDGSFAEDMKKQWGRRAVLAGLASAGGAGTLWWLMGARASATITGQGADGICVVPPEETAGPYPGDGTNARAGSTVNVLTESGVERRDITGSFGQMSGVADGVALDLEIRLVNVNSACAPVSGLALYLWHCDADGKYSLYSLPGENYLRGLQRSDEAGIIRFKTILPGCYDGRWPHMHFEVFASAEAAVSGRNALLTSQFAMPAELCQSVYAADRRYPTSLSNLGRVSPERDNVFGDNSAQELAAQTLTITGDAASGLKGVVTVALAL